MLFLSGLLLGVSLWNIDWAMWRRDFYLYYPPFYWHVKASQVYGLGFWVNIQYFQVVVAFILAIISIYMLVLGRIFEHEK